MINNFSFYEEPAIEMVTKSSCLALHGGLLQQLLYLKIVIGVLILALILFLLVELKRKIKS